MLLALNHLRGFTIGARDGDIGAVHDFYIDQPRWRVRYLVVDTRRWLPGRKVLLSPEAVTGMNGEEHVLRVGLTKELVESSPDWREHQPFSLDIAEATNEHFGWDASSWFASPASAPASEPTAAPTAQEEWRGPDRTHAPARGLDAPLLRSARELGGYAVRATDGTLGHVEDFVVDTDGSIVRYAVVDTRDWLPGRKVLVAVGWLTEIEWADASVSLDMTRREVAESPEFDPSAPVNRSYETRLHDFYGRPKYWA